MTPPEQPPNEAQRLDHLQRTGLLDSPPEDRFDRITRLARELFGVEMALVSLVDRDRQWFKSNQGLDATETPRDVSFCGHVVASGAPLVLQDTHQDERFADNPLVTGDPRLRFYAGWPLRTPEGYTLGTLCLLSRDPRPVKPEELPILRDLAEVVSNEIAAEATRSTDPTAGVASRPTFLTLGHQAIASAGAGNRLLGILVVAPPDPREMARRGELDGWIASTAADLREDGGVALVGRTGRHQLAVMVMATSTPELASRRDGLTDRVQRAGSAVGWAQWDLDRAPDVEDLLLEADAILYGSRATRTA